MGRRLQPMMGPPQIEQKNPGDLSPRTHWMKGGTMKLKSNDPLLRASHEVRFGGGSTKTRVNHLREVKKFVEELRKQGYGVKHWKNITNKHVGVVVDAWKDRGLANATIRNISPAFALWRRDGAMIASLPKTRISASVNVHRSQTRICPCLRRSMSLPYPT